MKTYTRNWIGTGLLIISCILLVVLFTMIDIDSENCSYSKYNKHTNITGAVKIFGSCYVPTNSVITKTEKCGFLGFSCRDVEPYQVNIGGSVCFKLKTGELC